MKKTSTYLFILMAVANVGVGLLIRHTDAIMIRAYREMLEGAPLPDLSRQMLSVPWWPFVFVCVGVLGAIVSAVSKIQSGLLSHALCIILIVEVAGLTLTAFALCLPMYIPTPKLLP